MAASATAMVILEQLFPSSLSQPSAPPGCGGCTTHKTFPTPVKYVHYKYGTCTVQYRTNFTVNRFLETFMRSSTLPATPAALSLYLLGSWTLSKTLQYTRGGRSGTFLGEARFSPLSDAVLSCEETGKAMLLPNNEQYEARHALLYDFNDNNDRGIVRVSFDEASDREFGGRRSERCTILSQH